MGMELIAYCGLYCGACSFKLAHDENDMEHVLRMPSRYDEYKKTMPEFCPGCRLENQCGPCSIRDCARGKEVDHCGQCDEFPCRKLIDFSRDGVPHHAESITNLEALNNLGTELWMECQQRQWACPCGSSLSWYSRDCRSCHAAPKP